MDAAQSFANKVLPSQVASAIGARPTPTTAANAWTSLQRALANKRHPLDAPLTLGAYFFASEKDLPPLLAPVPGLCRLAALLTMLPIVVLCVLDFAGYAIFRTLGFRRRRVRVKRAPPASSGQPLTTEKLAASQGNASRSNHKRAASGSHSSARAPVLQPGSYDADTLLRHRARSISAASAEAEEEWMRSGGTLARVSHIRAMQEAAAASPGADPSSYAEAAAKKVNVPLGHSTSNGSESSVDGPRINVSSASSSSLRYRQDSSATSPSLTPPESPRQAFLGSSSIGVQGAMGYFDTDAEEESGTEGGQSQNSGADSPDEVRRGGGMSPRAGAGSRSPRRGLGKSTFSFTPMSPHSTSTGSGSIDSMSSPAPVLAAGSTDLAPMGLAGERSNESAGQTMTSEDGTTVDASAGASDRIAREGVDVSHAKR